MSLLKKVVGAIPGVEIKPNPMGTIKVADFSPLNWLYITYNTVEELIRVSPEGKVIPAAMSLYHWVDDKTLEVTVREGEIFPDGEALTSATVKQSFTEMMRWQSPHPPGSQFNHLPGTRCEIVDDRKVRFHFPQADGMALGKFRAMHLMNTRFWNETGFGYKRNGSGEGHW